MDKNNGDFDRKAEWFACILVAVIDLQSWIGPTKNLGTTFRALTKSFSSIQSLLLYRIKDIEYSG